MKILNLPSEHLPAGTYEPMNLIEQAISLRIMARKLRAKSEDLRRRNMIVLRAADAAAKRGFQVSFDVFEARMEMRFALDS